MRFLFVFLSSLIFINGFSQLSERPDSNSINGSKSEFQKSSAESKDDKDYKLFNRWSEFYSTRTDAKGDFVSTEHYMQAALEVVKQKSTSNYSRASDSTWAPEGPDTLVESYNPISGHGVGRVNCITFHPSDSSTYWVGVAQGGIWKTTNSGKTYFPINNNLPVLRVSDIAVDPKNPQTLYVSLGDFAYIGFSLESVGAKRHSHFGMGVYKSVDGGLSWAPTGLIYGHNDIDLSLIRRVFVNPKNNLELIAAGTNGVWKSYDAGQTWNRTLNELIWDLESNSQNPNSILASSGYVHFTKTGNAGIWKSTDFGTTWNKMKAPIVGKNQVQRIELTISEFDTTICYAVACGLDESFAAFYQSTDGGLNWSEKSNSNTAPNLLGWGVGSKGGQATYDLLVYSDIKNPDRVFVGGIFMWGSDDAGLSWNVVSGWNRDHGFTPHGDHHFMKYNFLDKNYYLCNDGGVFRTKSVLMGSWDSTRNTNYKFPTKWEDVSSGMQITSLYRLGLSKNNAGALIAGAQDNGTFYRNSLGKWTNIGSGDGMGCFLDENNPKTGVFSSQYGTIWKMIDEGRSSSKLIRTQGFGPQSAWTAPIVKHPNNSSFFYGVRNVFICTTDSISRCSGFYNLVPSLTNAPISAMDISDKKDSYLVLAKRVDYQKGYKGEMYKTEDSGHSWTNLTHGLPDSLFFTSIKIDDNNPDFIWVSNGGFVPGVKIFKSRDGGSTWVNISRNLPNVPVNCIELDHLSKNNAVYIGTDVGVYYTNDDINSWILFSKGLPNVIVSDLKVHNKDRKLYCATFGRGIWSVDLLDSVFDFNTPTNSEYWNKSSFIIAPNPNFGSFKLKYETDLTGNWDVEVINVMGNILFQNSEPFSSFKGTKDFDLDLPSGIYYLRLSKQGRSKTLKFLVD